MAIQVLTNPYWLQQVFSGHVLPAGLAYLPPRSAWCDRWKVFNTLPAFGDGIAIGNTVRTAVDWIITQVARTAAACAIATRISGDALVSVAWGH